MLLIIFIKLNMPGGGPIEQLTAMLKSIKWALLRAADMLALAISQQPIADTATAILQQIRAVTGLFWPPPTT